MVASGTYGYGDEAKELAEIKNISLYFIHVETKLLNIIDCMKISTQYDTYVGVRALS